MSANSTPIWNVGSLLAWTTDFFNRRQIDEARLSAELLLAHALNCSRMALYTQYDRVPPDIQITTFRELVKLRSNHTPVAYLVGKAWFFSLEFAVTRDVLIPRPDTETLVENVISQVRQKNAWSAEGASSPAILDLCTGSGCIAITLAKNLPSAIITATDISPAALAVAQKNAAAHGVADRITFVVGDLYDALANLPAPTLYHVIAANPPYIPSAALADVSPTVRDHEPHLALDGGPDGLNLHRRILEGSKSFLHPDGLLIQEMQFDQGPALLAAYAAAGHLAPARLIRDAAGHPRCILAPRTPL